jgi:hypothetical protein
VGTVPVAKPRPTPGPVRFRRRLFLLTLLLVTVLVTIVIAVSTVYPRNMRNPVVSMGSVDQYESGTVEPERGFYLVRLEDGSFRALKGHEISHANDPIQWRPDIEMAGSHGVFISANSRYRQDGTLILGPSLRNMDEYRVEIVDDKVYVDTSTLFCGDPQQNGADGCQPRPQGSEAR